MPLPSTNFAFHLVALLFEFGWCAEEHGVADRRYVHTSARAHEGSPPASMIFGQVSIVPSFSSRCCATAELPIPAMTVAVTLVVTTLPVRQSRTAGCPCVYFRHTQSLTDHKCQVTKASHRPLITLVAVVRTASRETEAGKSFARCSHMRASESSATGSPNARVSGRHPSTVCRSTAFQQDPRKPPTGRWDL